MGLYILHAYTSVEKSSNRAPIESLGLKRNKINVFFKDNFRIIDSTYTYILQQTESVTLNRVEHKLRNYRGPTIVEAADLSLDLRDRVITSIRIGRY